MSAEAKATTAAKGTVYLVGAGPGDPELLTIKALRLLESADLVLHDDLVTDAVLALIPPSTRVVSVGKRYEQARTTQVEIHVQMIEAAHAGLSVVRLKSGDPLVFGRAAEEIEALRAAGVPFQIVPGVSAVFAAGAALAVPLTDRSTASKLVLMTAHQAADKSVAVPLWPGILPDDATLAIYMPGRNFVSLARDLLQAGIASETPCVAVSRAASPHQQTRSTRLANLAEMVPGPAPLLLLVGRALESLLEMPEAEMAASVAAFLPGK